MTYAMTNHTRKSSTCKSPHGMTHFQRYECASCTARTTCFNMAVDAEEAHRTGIVENEEMKTHQQTTVLDYYKIMDALHVEAIAEDNERDADDPTNPASDHQANQNAAAAVQADREALRAESNRLIAEQRARDTVATELAHREALAEVPQVRIINPEIDKEMFDTMRMEDRRAAEVREQSDMDE